MQLLKEYIKQVLLLEGRLEDVLAKYPEYESIIHTMAEADPSGNLKYLAWEMKMIANEAGDNMLIHEDEVIDYINRFDAISRKKLIEPKDINAYANFPNLRYAVEEVEEQIKEKELKRSAETNAIRIYDDEDWAVLHPKTKDSACFYGKQARWCVAMLDGKYYEQYTEAASDFIYIINKEEGRSEIYEPGPWGKAALQFRPWKAIPDITYKPQILIGDTQNATNIGDFQVHAWDAQDNDIGIERLESEGGYPKEMIEKAISFYRNNLFTSPSLVERVAALLHEHGKGENGDDRIVLEELIVAGAFQKEFIQKVISYMDSTNMLDRRHKSWILKILKPEERKEFENQILANAEAGEISDWKLLAKESQDIDILFKALDYDENHSGIYDMLPRGADLPMAVWNKILETIPNIGNFGENILYDAVELRDDTPPEILLALIKVGIPADLIQQIAKMENVGTEVMKAVWEPMKKLTDHYIENGISLRGLSRTIMQYFKNPDTPKEMIYDFLSDLETLRKAFSMPILNYLATSLKLLDERMANTIFDFISGEDNEGFYTDIEEGLAGNVNTPPDILAKLFQNINVEVNAVQNPNFPMQAVFGNMADEQFTNLSRSVLGAMARNRSTPDIFLSRIIDLIPDKFFTIKERIAGNPSASNETLKRLVDENPDAARPYISENPRIKKEKLALEKELRAKYPDPNIDLILGPHVVLFFDKEMKKIHREDGPALIDLLDPSENEWFYKGKPYGEGEEKPANFPV